MPSWKKIAMGAGISLAALLVLISVAVTLVRWRRRRRNRQGQQEQEEDQQHHQHQQQHQQQQQAAEDSAKRRAFAYNRALPSVQASELAAMEGIQMAAKWRDLHPLNKPFNWSDFPLLVADAMQRGWAAFAFTFSCTSRCPPSSAKAFVLCTKCRLGESFQPEVSWEIGPGTDFMQLIRLNPRLQLQGPRILQDSPERGLLVQALQSALPLPGPPSPLAYYAGGTSSSSFPKDGYFEVTIVAVGCEERAVAVSDSTENDNIKLILKPSPSERYPLAGSSRKYAHSASAGAAAAGNYSSTKSSIQARILANGLVTTDHHARKNEGESSADTNLLGVGFSAGVAPPFRLPGADQGSIGFLSDGKVYCNGLLRNSTHRGGWGTLVNSTIGCGFSPRTKVVYFTLDGEYVAEVSSREFNYPLHATLASNYDVTLLVNFGQCSFEYLPANSDRVADPSSNNSSSSLRTKSVNSSSAFYDDGSSDLFSIHRLDSHGWWSGRRTASYAEADSDLFEIALSS